MEEIFDVYTPEGTETGEKATRSEVHRQALWHRTAHIWIYNQECGLLLQKRAADKDSHPSLWDISAAGHIPAGESTLNAAMRECREEIGVTFPPEAFKEIGARKQLFDFPENNFYDREHVTIYLIDSPLPIRAYRAQPEEVEELRYISLADLSKAVESRSEWLVPHWEEYEKVLSYLNS